MLRTTVSLLILLLASLPVHAYIGPGAGISVLGSIVSVVIGVILAIAAVALWPLRRMLKKRRERTAADSAESDA